MKNEFIGWATVGSNTYDLVEGPRKFLRGILFDKAIRPIENLLGIRTMVYRTRQQARERKREAYCPVRVAKVKVTIEVIEYD